MKNRLKWLTSPHYKMERFGLMFTGLLLCMCILLGFVVQHKKVVDANTLSDQVQYTQQATMSLSGNTAQVVGVYLDSAQTECFVLLKWDDPSILVSDAAEYRMFVTGSDIYGVYTDLYSKPMGQIYMFGSTGYMGLYLTDSAGFPTQVISIIGRCESTLHIQDNVPTYSDSTFNEYDQFEIYLNPGAAGFEPAAFLDEDRMTLYDIYEGTVIEGQEIGIKETLETDLQKMETLLTQIKQYETRIEGTTFNDDGGRFVVVPDAPLAIRGDQVITDENGVRTFVSVTDLAGGYDVDWRNHTMRDGGYLDSIVPEGTTASKYIATQMSLADIVEREGLAVDDVLWYWSDGTRYTGENITQSSRLDSLAKDIASLKDAWTEYYKLKIDYQITQQEALLLLELNARDVIQTYTINNAENVVTLW